MEASSSQQQIGSTSYLQKESPLGLYIAVIKQDPTANRDNHKKAFRRLLLQDGYEDFVDAIIDEWSRIKYSTALRAANPPSVEEIKKRVVERKEQAKALRVKSVKAAEVAKELIGSRLLDLPMPNGKPLRECTGRDCIAFGGLYTKIGKRVGPDKIVGKVLSADDIAVMWKG